MKIKICGVTTVEDARLAAELGADAIGVNFYSGSKRYVGEETAAAIVEALPPFVEAVGVFVNEPFSRIASVAERLGIRTVQWHGDVGQAFQPAFPGTLETLPHLRFLPAFPVRDRDSLAVIDAYLDCCREVGSLPAAVLVDAHVPGEYGGTGRCAPWDLLADFRPGVPLMLAGGLTPENVAEAIRIVRPYAVDVASGVESRPGRKDAEKMRRFIAAARDSQGQRGAPPPSKI